MTSFVAAVQDAERAQLIVDLKAARRELVARGRCREKFVDDDKVCTLGAVGMAVVCGFTEMTDDAREAALYFDPRCNRVRRALSNLLGEWAVEDFNDASDTTDQDVLDLFDKTLADLGGLA